jgi:hypothetical protein
MCGAVDCRAGKGLIRGEVGSIGGMHATRLQVYLTHAQANYHTEPCGTVEPLASCGRWYEVRERQMGQMAGHASRHVREGDGPVLYLGDLNVPARDFAKDGVHQFFQVYDVGGDTEYDRLLSILDVSGTGRGVKDAYRVVHPPNDLSVDPDEMLPYFTSNPTWNHLTDPPWHGRIDYQLVDDSRSCYRLEPVSAEHVDLRYPSCNTGPGDSLSDHFAVGVRYNVYRKTDRSCNLVNPPLELETPVARVFPEPYGSGMSLAWSEPASPGTEYYEIHTSTDGGATWQVYTDDRSASHGPWINHHGNLACGAGYSRCLESSRHYDYRVRALDRARAPLTPWSNVAGTTSRDWSDLRPNRPPVVAAPAFESREWREGVHFQVEVSDPDVADRVEVSFEGLPAPHRASLLPSAGTGSVSAFFSWQPSPSDAGSYTLRFLARDEHGAATEASTTIDVWSDPDDPCPTCLLRPLSPGVLEDP